MPAIDADGKGFVGPITARTVSEKGICAARSARFDAGASPAPFARSSRHFAPRRCTGNCTNRRHRWRNTGDLARINGLATHPEADERQDEAEHEPDVLSAEGLNRADTVLMADGGHGSARAGRKSPSRCRDRTRTRGAGIPPLRCSSHRPIPWLRAGRWRFPRAGSAC